MMPANSLPDPVTKPEFYAGVNTKRLLAWVIDVVMITAFTVLLCLLTLGIGFFLFVAIYAVVGFVYRWLTLSGGSSTWGMRMMAIELREGDGQRLSSGTALLHTVGFYVSMAMALVQPVSVLMMMLSARRQGLSDMVLNTAMINRPLETLR